MDNIKEFWLKLFNAKTEEDLEKLSALEVPFMSEAVAAYRQVSASSEFKEYERIRSKARHDEAQALYSAEQRGATQERRKWQGVVADLTAEKDAEIANKDSLLADKDALIKELLAQLGK